MLRIRTSRLLGYQTDAQLLLGTSLLSNITEYVNLGKQFSKYQDLLLPLDDIINYLTTNKAPRAHF